MILDTEIGVKEEIALFDEILHTCNDMQNTMHSGHATPRNRIISNSKMLARVLLLKRTVKIRTKPPLYSHNLTSMFLHIYVCNLTTYNECVSVQ